MKTRILLADDHQIMREGLRTLIEREIAMEVVAEAADGRSAVRLVRDTRPDVVIMDVAMPELNGIEATRQIRADFPGVKTIALSMHSDQRFVSEILGAGAAGYLLKECAFEELAQAIRTVQSGRVYLSPGIAGIVVDGFVQRSTVTPSRTVSRTLTDREREVLQLLAEGCSTRTTAGRLHVSVKTVETHRRNVMRKLNAHSIAELTKLAIIEGVTSLEVKGSK